MGTDRVVFRFSVRCLEQKEHDASEENWVVLVLSVTRL